MKPSDPDSTEIHSEKVQPPFAERAKREAIAWIWIILAFLFIYSAIGQARVIPSESMEDTLLVGDHLIMSRIGYDVGLPFTPWHIALWRNPKRQQIVIIRSQQGEPVDLIKRVIGLPGDKIEIHDGAVWVNGQRLNEPYLKEPMNTDIVFNYNSLVVPPNSYFVMGDNRNDSYDSRYWGPAPRSALIGVPVMIYLSIDAKAAPDRSRTDAWEPGHLVERFEAYASVFIHPSRVRWNRLFHFF